MFKICVVLLIIVLIVISSLIAWLMRPLDDETIEVNIHDKEFFIAHAAGGIENYTYTNSKEALLNAIENGYKYIELDLYLTTDSQVVCLVSCQF